MNEFFKVSYEEEDIRDSGNTSYIMTSGIYPITIEAGFYKKTTKGSESIGFLINHEGQQQILFDAIRLTNNDGSDNNQKNLLNKLCLIAGIEKLANPEKAELPIGKKQAMEEVDVFAELCGIDVYVRIQYEYSLYEDKIQERKVVKSFFRASDFATAAEICNKVPVKQGDGSEQDAYIGKQYERELKDATKVKYNNDLTEEQVAEWIKNDRGANKETKATKAPTAVYKGTSRFQKK